MFYLLVFVGIVIVLLLGVRIGFVTNDLTDKDRRLLNNSLTPLTDDSLKVNCLHTKRFCTDDLHCGALCTRDVISKHQIMCKQGVCQAKTAPDEITTCQAKLGFLSVYNNNEIFRRWFCLNTLPHLFQNNGTLHPYVCGNEAETGVFDFACFDADKSIDAIPCCKCNDGYVRVVEASVPNVPLCVPEHVPSVFSSFVRV